MTDTAELERRLSEARDLERNVVVFQVEEESGIKLLVFGEVVANCGEHSRAGIALLKLGAALRALATNPQEPT